MYICVCLCVYFKLFFRQLNIRQHRTAVPERRKKEINTRTSFLERPREAEAVRQNARDAHKRDAKGCAQGFGQALIPKLWSTSHAITRNSRMNRTRVHIWLAIVCSLTNENGCCCC